MNSRNGRIRAISSLLLISVTILLLTRQQTIKRSSPEFPSYLRNIKALPKNETVKFYSGKVWLASGISVFIISAVGLLGVAVVPLVQKVFYNKIIQYLVALAVGSLTGDAFLHLLPHAIGGGHAEAEGPGAENEEFIGVLKGLVALGGVYFFFFAEKFLSMISEYRAEKRAEEEERERQLKDPRRSELRRLSAMQLASPGGGRRGSQMGNARDSAMFRRLSKVPSPEDDDDGIIMTGLSSRAMKSVNNLIRFSELDMDDDLLNTTVKSSSGVGAGGGGEYLSVPGVTVTYEAPNSDDEGGDIKLMVPSIKPTPEDASGKHHHHVKINEKDAENHEKKEKDESGGTVATTVEVREPAKQSGHGHGHSHEVPGSIAAVAWMVILGDGLHNFSDGLAIGAAFADKISGGVSTAVAVFCHELPHELGDFAVLLKTGMSVKQALFYNIVSSILCFIGMVIGIALNNVEDASYWIFAVTAGTFVYIALVDMLPELNSAEVRPGESRIAHFLIQILGLATGVGIMFLIAVFEEDIKGMLETSKKNV